VYPGSHAGALKNAIDYCGFDEFENSTVGLLAVSGGSVPLTALDHLRAVCQSLEPGVLPYQAAVPRARAVIEDQHVTDEDLQDGVLALGCPAVRFVNTEPDPTTFESEPNLGADD